MATWPETLPAPLLSGFAPAWRSNVIRTPMEVGHTRVRVLTREKRLRTPLSFKLDFNQLQTFDAWYQSGAGANYGANRFTVDWDIGYGVQTYECLLTTEPTIGVIAPKRRYQLDFSQVELRQL